MRRRNARSLAAVAIAVLLGVASSVIPPLPITIVYPADKITSGNQDPNCSGQHTAAATTITTARVPEPTTVALLGLGLVAIGSARKYLNG